MNTQLTDPTMLKSSYLTTPLGEMLAIADAQALYFLGFTEQRHLSQALDKLLTYTKAIIHSGHNDIIAMISTELQAYFAGKLKNFNTPLQLTGSPFQQLVWQGMRDIAYGHTRSYLAQSQALGKPNACRAVANANGANPLVIVLPCHRIINSNGGLGGYSGGLMRKKWLLEHEQAK
jgi:AraC family transcriptional regulator, regulatory protein of adaptative response / methylated-DNA-[protein]-cysteine methyltransferase